MGHLLLPRHGGRRATTFAARGVGYGLPALRVDGNDFLAVYAATQWAAERARANLGATVIELFTYRAGQHSTSDDPPATAPPGRRAVAAGRSRGAAEGPPDRARCLVGRRARGLCEEAAEAVRAAARESEAIGTLGQSRPPVSEMFDDVFKQSDWRLDRQRQELGV